MESQTKENTMTLQTIEVFFKGEKQYTIPVYQRAYSWGESQWSVFLEDLKEATNGSNKYFFGNVLLEELENSDTKDIIDGQQRLTTITIFVRSLVNILEEPKNNKEKFDAQKSNEEFIKNIIDNYLIKNDKSKLRAVDYDRDYFDNIIIKNDNDMHKPETPSQKRIKEAKEYFKKELEKLESKELVNIFQAMQNAEILSVPFKRKKDSVLMFELQNNRGKDLTNMEKLKSYLAYQIFIYSEDAESKLNDTTDIFKEIYRKIKNIGFNEDSILSWFNISRSSIGYNYRENDDLLNYKKELKDIQADEKIKWIEDYVKELKNAFVDFKDFEESSSVYKTYLQILDVWEVYPFIIKAYRLFRDDKNTLEEVFKALEIIAFRHKLTRRGASLSSRLNDVLKNFTSVENLVEGLKKVCSTKELYWSDEEIKNNSLNVIYKYYSSEKQKDYSSEKQKCKTLTYLFMHYENFLKSKSAEKKGYPFKPFKLEDIENPEIEHIAPQTETIEKNGEKIENGYCEYDEKFKDKFLNCIGNLVLISESHNCSIGNKPFTDKLNSFTHLEQQKEIKDFASKDTQAKPLWDKEAINKRHKKLENFVLETWSFK